MFGFTKNRPLSVLLITNSMILIAGGLLGPIYALFVEEVGGDILDAGIAGSIFAFVAGITVLLAGKYSDTAKRPDLIVSFGYCVMGLGYLSYMLVGSIYQLFLVQVIIGFGEAMYLPSFDALYSRHLDGDKEGSQWGAWEAMNYFAMAIGAIFGGFVAHQYGFTSLFVIMALLCFISALYTQSLHKLQSRG